MRDNESIDLRVGAVEGAVRKLATDFHSLQGTMLTVSALAEAQREQSARQAAIERDAKDATAQQLSRDHRLNMTQRITAVALAVSVPLASVLAYWSLTVQVNRQFDQQQGDLVKGCELRNEVNIFAPRRRELALARAHRADGSPAIAQIHQQSADDLNKGVVDCSIYRRPAK